MSTKVFERSAMINSLCITPSPGRGRGNGPETRPGIEPSGRGDVIPNLPALTGTPALQGGEEVSRAIIRSVILD
jgi:putative transposase